MHALDRALTRILKIGVKTLPSRKSWSFTIHFHWHFSKSWSQIQKVGVKNSKFGVNETSDWTVFNTSFNEEKCLHLSVLIYSNIYWGPNGHFSSLFVIGSFTCILGLYILCLMLITLTEWFCTVVYILLYVRFLL